MSSSGLTARAAEADGAERAQLRLGIAREQRRGKRQLGVRISLSSHAQCQRELSRCRAGADRVHGGCLGAKAPCF